MEDDLESTRLAERLVVGRPEFGAGHIRQRSERRGRDSWERVNGLGAIGIAEDVRRGEVEVCARFQIICPLVDSDAVAGGFVVFNRILVNCGVDQAQIVNDTAGLRTLASAQEPWDCNGGQQCDDGDNDHNFDECKPAPFVKSRSGHSLEIIASVMPLYR